MLTSGLRKKNDITNKNKYPIFNQDMASFLASTTVTYISNETVY
jgi:hypothetical protein